MKNLVFTICLLSSTALACVYHVDDFKYPDKLEYAKHKLGCEHEKEVVNTDIHCGDVLTSDSALTQDLDCTGYTGFVLKVEGSNITFDGRGHKIVAPHAAAGVYVQGSNDTVENVEIDGVTEGYGVFVYDSPGVRVRKNILNGNLIGVMLYSEIVTMTGSKVHRNIVKNSLQFAVRTGQDTSGHIVNPSIRKNDMSDSGSYALYVQADTYTLDGCEDNDYSRSLDGIYLKTGSFDIHDLSLKKYEIKNAEIFVDTAKSVEVRNVDVSTCLAPNSNQEHVGLDFYRVLEFCVSGLTAKGNDVGLKLETDSGYSPSGHVDRCEFDHDTVAGIEIVSYDGTRYGKLLFDDNRFCEDPLDVLLESGTFVGVGSEL